ncbi:uncharacterized protein LOC142556982 isoform X3 [Dermacentor variabilis]|uniref:uncharacterized protein LOC142556982 isoform X3 n=1 Tax=Dermacentor variabilis TaxID=34621 RepID=UPI003F5BAD18
MPQDLSTARTLPQFPFWLRLERHTWQIEPVKECWLCFHIVFLNSLQIRAIAAAVNSTNQVRTTFSESGSDLKGPRPAKGASLPKILLACSIDNCFV